MSLAGPFSAMFPKEEQFDDFADRFAVTIGTACYGRSFFMAFG